MCGSCKCSKKPLGTITLTEEEKDFLVELLGNILFHISDLVIADKIMHKIDDAFPITEE